MGCPVLDTASSIPLNLTVLPTFHPSFFPHLPPSLYLNHFSCMYPYWTCYTSTHILWHMKAQISCEIFYCIYRCWWYIIPYPPKFHPGTRLHTAKPLCSQFTPHRAVYSLHAHLRSSLLPRSGFKLGGALGSPSLQTGVHRTGLQVSSESQTECELFPHYIVRHHHPAAGHPDSEQRLFSERALT